MCTPGSSYMDAFKFSDNPVMQRAWKERMEEWIYTYPKTANEQVKVLLQDEELAWYDNFIAIRYVNKGMNEELVVSSIFMSCLTLALF